MKTKIITIKSVKDDVELNIIEDKTRKLQEELDGYKSIIENMKHERYKQSLQDKSYFTFPLDKKYIGKEINKITFIDINGNTQTYYNDESFDVDEQGYPNYSSYEHGLLRWEKDSFYYLFYGSKRKLDYIGYVELEIQDDEE